MDFFTGKRITTFFIALLVLLNLGLLITFWYSNLKPRRENKLKDTRTAPPIESDRGRRPGERPKEERNRRSQRLVEFLQRELNFSQEQSAAFQKLREEHFRTAGTLKRRMDDLRKEMMDKLLEEAPDAAEAGRLADQMGDTMAEHETAVFKHFLQLMEICDEEQKPKYKRLMREILDQLKPPGGPGGHGPPIRHGPQDHRRDRPPPHHRQPPPRHRDGPPPKHSPPNQPIP